MELDKEGILRRLKEGYGGGTERGREEEKRN